MDITGAKVLAAFMFFILVIIFGWVPSWCCTQLIRIKSRSGLDSRGQTTLPVIRYLHGLASGVLVGTCFLHLLPESIQTVRFVLGTLYENGKPHPMLNTSQAGNSTDNLNTTFDQFREQNHTLHTVNFLNENTTSVNDHNDDGGILDIYPLAEILVAFGFLCVYMVDSTIKLSRNKVPKRKSPLHDVTDDDIRETVLYETGMSPSEGNVRTAWSKDTATSTSQASTMESESMLHSEVSQDLTSSDLRGKFDDSTDSLSLVAAHIQYNPAFSDTETLEHGNDAQHEKLPTDDVDDTVLMQSSQEFHHVGERRATQKFNHLRSVALVTALCIHGFFDGMMIGLQTSLSALKAVMFALALHKSFVAIGLSLTLMGNKTSPRHTFYYILAFASVAPLGVLTGALSVHLGEDTFGSILPGCLQSFAVGTFLYVCFTETTERQGPTSLSQQIINHIFLLTGFVFMAGFRAYTGSI